MKAFGGIVLAMFAPPLSYSAYVFSRAEQPSDTNRISVMAVQPNVDPWLKTDERVRSKVVGDIVSQTDKALKRETVRPDLILWPEAAVPLPLLQDELAEEFVFRNVARWNVPVVTGTLDVRTYGKNEPLPPRLEQARKNYELFNAAVMLEPVADGTGATTIRPSEAYRKRRLMPFAEYVPFSDRFPRLSRFTVDLNWHEEFAVGTKPTLFSFQTRQGRRVTVAAPICYEHFYPALTAEFVRDGAQLITLLSNDAWFSKSHGEHQIAAFTTLRAVETRRTVVRCTNTGLTRVIDPFGRIQAEIPWWRKDAMVADATLSDRLCLYVRYPDLFPMICAWLTLALLGAAFLKATRYRGRY